jgi:hypothetical protein
MWTCPKCKEQIDDQFDSCWKCAEAVPSEPLPARCFKCGGTQIAKGELEATHRDFLTEILFRPDKLRFLTLTLAHGTTLDTESFACLSCGTVWSQTNPDALKDFIQKHCRHTGHEESAA